MGRHVGLHGSQMISGTGKGAMVTDGWRLSTMDTDHRDQEPPLRSLLCPCEGIATPPAVPLPRLGSRACQDVSWSEPRAPRRLAATVGSGSSVEPCHQAPEQNSRISPGPYSRAK